jgi:hypothetical protein
MDDIINTIELVTLQGDVIEINFPGSIADEVFEDYYEYRQRKGWWNVGDWDDVKVKYKGHRLSEINMAQIIGTR